MRLIIPAPWTRLLKRRIKFSVFSLSVLVTSMFIIGGNTLPQGLFLGNGFPSYNFLLSPSLRAGVFAVHFALVAVVLWGVKMDHAFYSAVVRRSRRRGARVGSGELEKARRIVELAYSSKAFVRSLRKRKLAVIGRVRLLEDGQAVTSGANYLATVASFVRVEALLTFIATLSHQEGFAQGRAHEKKRKKK